MESYTHEEFIQAMKMQGKQVAVTAEQIEREQRRKEERQSILEVRGANTDGPSSGKRWELQQELDAIEREKRLRSEAKLKQRELESLVGNRSKPAPTPTMEVVTQKKSPVPAEGPTPVESPIIQSVSVEPESSPKEEPILDGDPKGSREDDPPQSDQQVEHLTEDRAPPDDATKCEDPAPSDPSGQACLKALPKEDTDVVVPPSVAKGMKPGGSRVRVPSGVPYQLLHGAEVSDTSEVRVALHWVGCVDLDLSAVCLTAEGKRVACFFFGETPFCNALKHSGDMLHGPRPNGAVEEISMRVGNLPTSVAVVYFVMTNFSGDSMDDVDVLSAYIRTTNGEQPDHVLRFDVDSPPGVRGCCLCRAFRRSNGWGVECLSSVKFDHGDTVRELVGDIEKHFERSPV